MGDGHPVLKTALGRIMSHVSRTKFEGEIILWSACGGRKWTVGPNIRLPTGR